MEALNQAIASAGGVGALARLLDIGQSVVSNWRARKSVPADACPLIELKLSGRLTCEVLRPDVTWQRVPDAKWPHPAGRPCIDVAKPVAAAADA